MLRLHGRLKFLHAILILSFLLRATTRMSVDGSRTDFLRLSSRHTSDTFAAACVLYSPTHPHGSPAPRRLCQVFRVDSDVQAVVPILIVRSKYCQKY
ncbi:hypothetical protein DEU56DRAFT_837280 [Suillus clintonianus]|uniref:uncharacterized protein n=1 Tax=Suillus clintonianus TaxID=1904413 RepID=UPI001B86FE2D|nr:uncharacterized protein DEU56DRAFT_837280 [Suillus clintonianus]KAG2119191.1 hypothetical protein DEU56DRAFT_837280 [Suillus clintonianus]